MSFSLSTAAKNAMLNALRDLIDSATDDDPGKIRIYTTPRPSSGDPITTQTLLGTLTFSFPSAPNAAGGVLTFDAIDDDTSADATGEAVWARIVTGDDAFVMDMDVSETDGDGEFKLVDTAISLGGTISVASGVISAA